MTTGAGRTRSDAARVLCVEVSRQGDAALKLDARTGRDPLKIHLNGPVCPCLWLVAADRLKWGFWGTCARWPTRGILVIQLPGEIRRFAYFLKFNFWVGERGQSSQVESSRVTWIYYALTWCPSRWLAAYLGRNRRVGVTGLPVMLNEWFDQFEGYKAIFIWHWAINFKARAITRRRIFFVLRC